MAAAKPKTPKKTSDKAEDLKQIKAVVKPEALKSGGKAKATPPKGGKPAPKAPVQDDEEAEA